VARECGRPSFEGAEATLHRASRKPKLVRNLGDGRIWMLTSCRGNTTHKSTLLKGISLLKSPYRLRLTHPSTNGALKVRRLSVDASIQLTTHLPNDAASLCFRNRTARPKAS
jgi:hypothetical protein